MPDYTNLTHFPWSASSSAVALKLAECASKEAAAKAGKVCRKTVYNWLANPAFCAEVDRLTLMVDVAGRAARVRVAKRVIAQKTAGGIIDTSKDLLDWLKYAQSETDGAKLNLARLALDHSQTP